MDLKEEQTAFRWEMAILQGLPVVGVGIYAFGFLATNIHLAKFGIYEFELVSSRYVIVGILYVLFVAFWLFFAGRSLWYMEWQEPEIEAENNMEWQEPETEAENNFASGLVQWIRFVFSICASTALFSLIFLGSAEAIFFSALLAIGWMVQPRWDNLCTSDALYKYKYVEWLDRFIYPTMWVLAILVFFATIEIESVAMILFLHFLVLSLYGKFVLRQAAAYWRDGERSESRREDFLQTVSHVFSFVLLSCASFGWLQYGQINPSFGGGVTRTVEMVVVDPNTTKNLENLGFSVRPSFRADVIHEMEDKIFVRVGSKTIQLYRPAIAGVQVLSTDSFGLGLYAKRILDEIMKKWEDVRLGVNSS